jgi:hypothetical protein
MPILNQYKLQNIKKNAEGPVYAVDASTILAGNKPSVYKWRGGIAFAEQSQILKNLQDYTLYETLIPLSLMETFFKFDPTFYGKQLSVINKIKEKVPEGIKTRGIFITSEGEVLYATNFSNEGDKLLELTF